MDCLIRYTRLMDFLLHVETVRFFYEYDPQLMVLSLVQGTLQKSHLMVIINDLQLKKSPAGLQTMIKVRFIHYMMPIHFFDYFPWTNTDTVCRGAGNNRQHTESLLSIPEIGQASLFFHLIKAINEFFTK